jgi:predicted phosphodiesterase
MSTASKMIFIGDSHGNWASFHSIAQQARARYPDAREIVSVGDFGCFPAQTGFTNRTGLPVRFIDGNHEDHPAIRDGSYKARFEADWIPRGTLESRVLFCGGADSIDREAQEKRGMWFPEEAVTLADVDVCLTAMDTLAVHSFDLVVAHDMPQIGYLRNGIFAHRGGKSPARLTAIHACTQPAFWVHGHHHKSMIYRIAGTWFVGLHATHFPDSSEETASAFWDGNRLFVGGNQISDWDFSGLQP